MILTHLSILNYKNISETELAFSPKVNCFVGQNGMGKTNLLDSIYHLSFCKSATNLIDSQNIRHAADFSMLQGQYDFDGGETEEITCSLRRKHGKKFRRGKKEYKRLSDHIGFLPLVQVSPADSLLISGGSEERRRFLDMVISQYDKPYLEALIRYNKALTQRNALLRMEGMTDESLFSLWEEVMDEAAQSVYEKRRSFVSEFIPIFNRLHAVITEGRDEVSLSYTSHLDRGSLRGQLAECRSKEQIVGYTLHGIHKDDLEMMLAGYALRREGSQGQRKSYLVALKFAQYLFLKEKLGVIPILLLDDLFDKLDAARVEQIIRLVSSSDFGQIFLTDTHRDHLYRILSRMQTPYRIFSIEQGEVRVEPDVES